MNALGPLRLALSFLTIVPLPRRAEWRPEDFGASLPWFSAAGALMALAAAGILYPLEFFPQTVRSLLAVALVTIASGALHLDGLADSTDGLYGSRPREKALEIMRDSRIGAMGAAAIALVLASKIVFYAALPGALFYGALFFSLALSRWTQALCCSLFPYARKEGKALFFFTPAHRTPVLLGGAAVWAAGTACLGPAAGAAALAGLAPAIVFAFRTNRWLGGLTGDTVGAASEIAETGVLLALCFFYYWEQGRP